MNPKTLIIPELKRTLDPPFAWIDRRFLFDGFLVSLRPAESLLYFFLCLVSDRDGLSFYSYDKICQLLKLDADAYIQARNALVQKGLIAFDGRQFQVLALPKKPFRQPAKTRDIRKRQPIISGQDSYPALHHDRDAKALSEIFARLAQQSATNKIS
jgi:hypothetical protein